MASDYKERYASQLPTILTFLALFVSLSFSRAYGAQASSGANDQVALPVAAHPQCDGQSSILIDYKNLDAVLAKYVWETGRSNRKYAYRPWVRIERIVRGNPNPTRLEANRLFFHIITNQDLNEIGQLLAVFQNLPHEINLSRCSRDEQLAYWLNLHNLAVIWSIAKRYPIANLEEINGEMEDDRFLQVNERRISIGDIRHRILPTISNDPLIMYGLYYGSVGGPNIIKRAFYGNTVRKQLDENAREFINSLRGVRFSNELLLISPLYQWYSTTSGWKEADILLHISKFAEGEVADRMIYYHQTKFSDFDWYIADLFNGKRPEPLGGAIVPPNVAQLLENVQERNRERKATVEIEEYDDKPKAPEH